MVSMSAKRAYGGVAADERRAIRRAALMEAALDLFAEDGARGVSKRAICARARLNDRYFYEHFTDADAVIEAIVQDGTVRGLEAVNAASQKAAPDIRAQVHATAVAALDFLTAIQDWCNYCCVRTPLRFCSAQGWRAPARSHARWPR